MDMGWKISSKADCARDWQIDLEFFLDIAGFSRRRQSALIELCLVKQ
jgi:hypothetical protein